MHEKIKLIEEYAQKNYREIFREPNGYLKYKFIVPGSKYSDNLWDWDSWLTNVALRQFVTDDIDNITEYEKGCILNFLNIMDEKGRIPIVITPNLYFPKVEELGNNEINIHKPCLAQHTAFLIKTYNGGAEWIRKDFSKLKLFVDYYINNMRHENGLYFWLDDNAIGVDNDPCTFFRPNKSSGSIFLNCLMYRELMAICYVGECLSQDVLKYKNEAENLKKAVRAHCFDEKDGFYYSVDLNLEPIIPGGKHKGCPRNWDNLIQRIGVWSGFLAMWSEIATKEQAERMVKENLLDEKAFWAPFGVRSLSKYEKMYQIVPSGNPSCWLGPVWGISNYLVFRGLVKYEFNDIAEVLAKKTITLFAEDIKKTGVLHEYYDPESGKPILNPGFQNWNLLAVNMSAWLEGKPVTEEF